jgi:hypothetical protein
MCVLGAIRQNSVYTEVMGGLLDINEGEKVLEHESVV